MAGEAQPRICPVTKKLNEATTPAKTFPNNTKHLLINT
jgi:hypothetical protein